MKSLRKCAAPDDAVVLERFHSSLGLVESRAAVLFRHVGRWGVVTLDDLRAFGRECLLHAARTYDEARGVPFGAWAELCLRRSMVDGIRQWGTRRGERRMRRLARARV
ncbi:MAG TPA: sigma factor [Polyangiaceae bacterium]|nr:sigma factor [Polyangiaceae bacterium]